MKVKVNLTITEDIEKEELDFDMSDVLMENGKEFKSKDDECPMSYMLGAYLMDVLNRLASGDKAEHKRMEKFLDACVDEQKAN